MGPQTVILRAATPTHEDGIACARYLDQAAEGFNGLWLGARSDEIVATAFLEADHDLSFENATLAERDGEVVGMYLAYTGKQHRRSTREPIERAADNSLRMKIVQFLLSPMMRIADSIEDGDYYLHAIAVDEAVRGAGVGSVLMEEYERAGLSKGALRLALDVAASNEAKLFYEHRGWQVESVWPKRFRLPGIKMYRMTKRLS